MRVLVVDDDRNILSLLSRGFAFEGFDVLIAEDGNQALAVAREQPPDIVVLDVMLPGLDGLEVCRRLRATSAAPVLMLTAKDTVPDKIKGLESGADDYVVKPFSFDEVLARVRALLRRVRPGEGSVLHFADLSLDTTTREARRGSRQLELTPKEFELLELLLRHPRQVLSRDQISRQVWGYDYDGLSNTIDVHVKYLREKTEAAGEPRLIQTIRGAGYALREV